MWRLSSGMRRLFSVSTVSGWKLIAAVAGLLADVEGVWIVSHAVLSLSDYPGPIMGGETTTTTLMRPQLLYYPAISLTVVLSVAGLFLLAYILTLLEKRVIVLRRVFPPDSGRN